MKNEGFALLVAIVFVSFVVGVGLIYITQISEIKNLATSSKMLAQQNALIYDATNILDTQAANINSNESLAVFFALSKNIKFENKDFSLDVTIESAHNKIPIKECQNPNNTFCEKLIAKLGGFNAKILSNKLVEQNQSAVSYADFSKIIDDIFLQTKDANLKNAKFENYFSFYNFDTNFLDCENMSPNLWSLVADIYSLNYTNCSDFIKKEPKSKVVNELRLKRFSDTNNYIILLKSDAKENKIKSNLQMFYDIKTKQIVDIKIEN